MRSLVFILFALWATILQHTLAQGPPGSGELQPCQTYEDETVCNYFGGRCFVYVNYQYYSCSPLNTQYPYILSCYCYYPPNYIPIKVEENGTKLQQQQEQQKTTIKEEPAKPTSEEIISAEE